MMDIQSDLDGSKIAPLYKMVLGLPVSIFVFPSNLYQLCRSYRIYSMGTLIEKVYFKHADFDKSSYLAVISKILHQIFGIDLNTMIEVVQKNGTIPLYFSLDEAKRHFKRYHANKLQQAIYEYNNRQLNRFKRGTINFKSEIVSSYKKLKSLAKVADIYKMSVHSVRQHIIDSNRLGLIKNDIIKSNRLSKLQLIKLLFKYIHIPECAKHCDYSAAGLYSLCKRYNITHADLLAIRKRSCMRRDRKTYIAAAQKLGYPVFARKITQSSQNDLAFDPNKVPLIHKTLLELPFDTFIMPLSLYQDCLKARLSNIAELIERIYCKKGRFNKPHYRDFLNKTIPLLIIDRDQSDDDEHDPNPARMVTRSFSARNYKKIEKNIADFNKQQVDQVSKTTIEQIIKLHDTYKKCNSLSAVAAICDISAETVRVQLINGGRLKLFDFKPNYYRNAAYYLISHFKLLRLLFKYIQLSKCAKKFGCSAYTFNKILAAHKITKDDLCKIQLRAEKYRIKRGYLAVYKKLGHCPSSGYLAKNLPYNWIYDNILRHWGSILIFKSELGIRLTRRQYRRLKIIKEKIHLIDKSDATRSMTLPERNEIRSDNPE